MILSLESPRDHVTVWTTPDGMMLLRALYTTQHFARHTHSTFVIGINRRSAHSFYCRHAVHSVPPGTIALVNPEEVHTGELSGGHEWRYRGMYPEPEWMGRLWQELEPGGVGATPVFPRPTVHDPALALQLERFHQRSELGGSTLTVESAGVEVFSRLLLRHAEGAPKLPCASREAVRIRTMREFLHGNLSRPVSLACLAELVGVGRFTALRLFRRELGITPHEYLTSLRVEEAKRLLLLGETIAQTAQLAGFSDQSHLTRRFKRHFGMTPGAFASRRTAFGRGRMVGGRPFGRTRMVG